MEPALNLLGIINLLGSAQALLLAIALLSIKRKDPTPNRILAALTIVISIIICGAVLRTTHYELMYLHLTRVHDPFVFLIGPLFFLYIRALTTKKRGLDKRDFLHFIPFIICVVYLIPYYLQSSAAKLQVLIAEANYPTLGKWYYIRSGLLLLQCFVYLILLSSMLIRYSRQVKKPISKAEQAVLFQTRFLVYGFITLFVIGLLRYTLDDTARTNLLVPLGASVLVYALGYLGLRRPEVLTGEAPVTNEAQPVNDATPAKKYEKSTLTPERSERYLKKLLHHMETAKPYVDGELTLSRLAEQLMIPAQHLSQIINERLNQNFFDFINTYRVEEAKRLLTEPSKKHYSVLAIAEEVGFNSKSSFNAVFKKHANMTPSEFRKISNSNGHESANS